MKKGKKRKADKTKSSTNSVLRKPPPPSHVPEPPKTKSKKKKTKEDKQKENLNEVASVYSKDANLNVDTLIPESNISEESAKTVPPQYKPEPPKVKSKSKSSLTKKEKKPKKQSSKRKNKGENDKKLLPGEPDSSKDKTKATPNAVKNSAKTEDPIYYDPVSFSRVPQRPETSAISSKDSNVPLSIADRHEANEAKEDIENSVSSGTNWRFLRVVARMSKRGSKSKQRPKIGSSDGMDKSLTTNNINSNSSKIGSSDGMDKALSTNNISSNSKEVNASPQELVNAAKIDGSPEVINKRQNPSAGDQVIDNAKSKKKLKRNSGNKPKAVSKVKSYPLASDSQTYNKGNDNRPVSEIIDTNSAKDAKLDKGDAKKIKEKKNRSTKKDRKLLSATKSVPLAAKDASESPRESKRPVLEIVQGDDNTLNPSLTGSKPSFVLSNESLASFSRRKSNLTASFRKKMRKLSGRKKADTETGKDNIVDASVVDQDSDSKTASVQPDVNANGNLDGENGVKGVETDVFDLKTKKKKARPDVPQRPKGVLELKAATTAVAGMKAVKEKPVVPPRPAGAIETLDTKTEPEVKNRSKKKKKSSKRKDTSSAASKQKDPTDSSQNNDKKGNSIDFRAATKVVMAVEKARPVVPPRPTLTVDKDSTNGIKVEDNNDEVEKRTDGKITLSLKENTSEETKKNAAKISKFSWFTAKLRGRQKARKEEGEKIDEKEAPKDLKIKPASSSVDLTDESPPSSQEKFKATKKSKFENYAKDVQNTTPSKTRDVSNSVRISKSGSPPKSNEITEPRVSSNEESAVSSSENPKERQVMRIPSIHVTPTAKRKKKDRQSLDGDDGKLNLTTRAKGEISSKYLKHLFSLWTLTEKSCEQLHSSKASCFFFFQALM